MVTNCDLKAEEIINQYANLWQVEEAFRVTKTDLKIRPVYHWKPERIKAHVLICFLAYSLGKNLKYRIKLKSKELMSEAVIRENLNKIQMSILRDIETNSRYAIPSRITNEGKKIYNSLNLQYSEIPFKL